MVAIRRSDTGEWAIPGGMQDPGEVGFQTLVREFREEAGAVSEAEQAEFDTLLKMVFNEDNGSVLYRGYVDDPRNTDHAWMETTAMHFHCPRGVGERLKLSAGDDATAVMWLEVGEHNPEYAALYGSHKQIVDLVWPTHGPEAANRARSRPPDVSRGGGGDSAARRLLQMSVQGLRAAFCLPRSQRSESSQGLARPRLGMLDRRFVKATAEHVRGSCGTFALDLDSICPSEMRRAVECVQLLVRMRRADGSDIDADLAAATKAVATSLEAKAAGDTGGAVGAGSGAAFNVSTSGNVYDNLKRLKPFSQWLPVLEARLLPLLESQRASWTFADDGTSGAPTLTSAADEVQLDGTAQAALRILAFIDKPPSLTAAPIIDRLRVHVLSGTHMADRPTAVVMAGPPGAGKSYSMSQLLPWLRREHGAPPREGYAYINPDLWIRKHCDNNNAYRALANYCNHETFLTCVGQRRHLIFDATGRTLVNTCGRIIGRLVRANYRVHLVVVLASYSACWKRVEARREKTGRAVPEKVFGDIFADLRRVVPVYLHGASNGLCETSVLCNNDRETAAKNVRKGREQPGVATLVPLTATSSEVEIASAVKVAEILLAPPDLVA